MFEGLMNRQLLLLKKLTSFHILNVYFDKNYFREKNKQILVIDLKIFYLL